MILDIRQAADGRGADQRAGFQHQRHAAAARHEEMIGQAEAAVEVVALLLRLDPHRQRGAMEALRDGACARSNPYCRAFRRAGSP